MNDLLIYLGQGLREKRNEIHFLCNSFQFENENINLVQGAILIAYLIKANSFSYGKPREDDLVQDRVIIIRLRGSMGLNEHQGVYADDHQKIMAARKKQIGEGGNAAFSEAPFFNVFCGEILGSFIEDDNKKPLFSGDHGNIYPACFYHLYVPGPVLLQRIANGTLTHSGCINFGLLRLSEDAAFKNSNVPVQISMMDIRGKRSAMFGKTRMGKSNVVKLIVQGMLDVTAVPKNVGQLIFDVNGEYANANPQDGTLAIAEAYKDRCLTYFLMQRGGNPDAKLLRFNFYERTEEAFAVMKELLPSEISAHQNVSQLLSCVMPKFKREEEHSEKSFSRNLRKIMLYWTILASAGFEVNANRLREKMAEMLVEKPFNPQFAHGLRMAAYQAMNNSPPPAPPSSFSEMVRELRVMASFCKEYENDPGLNKDGEFIFDLEEEIMISFLSPAAGQGPHLLRPCLQYHSSNAEDFILEILKALDAGSTVIVDLGSANEQVIRYFAKSLSSAVFQEQERKFVSNQLEGKFVQIYFEEAHQ